MFKQLLISTMVLSIFGSTPVLASSTNSNNDMTPKEEHEVVVKKIKEVKSILKKLEDEHKSIKKINIEKEENLNNLEKTILDEQKELNSIKESVKKEKERIEEKIRLEKIQKEKELAEQEQARIAQEQARVAQEQARLAQEQAKVAQEVSTTSTTTTSNASSIPTGAKLTPSAGVFQGPSGKETYYNLPMQGVVSIAKSMGIAGDYWVRGDGVKMYGDYVIVAANLNIRPRGSLVPTSLGMGIVLDTGGFASSNPTQLDIATSW